MHVLSQRYSSRVQWQSGRTDVAAYRCQDVYEYLAVDTPQPEGKQALDSVEHMDRLASGAHVHLDPRAVASYQQRAATRCPLVLQHRRIVF